MTGRKRILVVDDTPLNREVLEGMLTGMGYEVEEAASGQAALEVLKRGYDLIMLDYMMPEMNGIDLTRRIRGGPHQPDVPICMVTALAGDEQRDRAIKSGVNAFLTKPVDMTKLETCVASLLQAKESQDAAKSPEAVAAAEITRLRESFESMSSALNKAERGELETIQALALASEFKEPNIANHLKRVRRYCEILVRMLNLPQAERKFIFFASPLHDVGKAGIPDSVLLKPTQLNPEEWAIMKRHTEIGGRILGDARSEFLQAGKIIALSHHENWDGSGYPNGLAGESIPLSGRICAIADVFDALTSRRPWRGPLPTDEALRIMREGKGTHFDPHLVSLFLDGFKEVEGIQRLFADPGVPAFVPSTTLRVTAGERTANTME